MLSTSLTEGGYATLIATNGREALLVLYRVPGIDAVILDIMMPEMEGIETLREIHRHWPGTPVIVISGGDRSGWTDALKMATEFGATRTLSKPFTPTQLINT